MSTSSEFGSYLREMRERLGLSLREYCRQTGLDPGNVSRLERGQSPPPRSERVLTDYAEGLRLSKGSAEWDRFMTLARPSGKPRQGLNHHNWVRARHLEDWARTRDAQAMLPHLVRRLIRATAEGDLRLECPSGEQVQRPGWDGIVDASGNSEFVPIGLSVWEMGVNQDPKQKAEGDFKKRQKESPKNKNKEVSFIFITPRKWQGKAEWRDEKAGRGVWKDVRVYDSASLEEWLECAPAVDIWLARQLGLATPGLSDVEGYWENLKGLTEPTFGPEVYLASRGKLVEDLKKWLEGPPDSRVLENRSPFDALAFVVAASQRGELGETFSTRALIVETRDAWRTFSRGDGGLILIGHPTLAIESELVTEAVRNGHHVLICDSGPGEKDPKRLQVPRVEGLDLLRALEIQGIEVAEALQMANAAGGSITVLKRRKARHQGKLHPEWSCSPEAQEVLPFLLVGRWSDTSEGDRTVLEDLAEISYRDVTKIARQWVESSDPLILNRLSHWTLASRDDSWALLSGFLTDHDLRRFTEQALKVLGEVVPLWELRAEKPWSPEIARTKRLYPTFR